MSYQGIETSHFKLVQFLLLYHVISNVHICSFTCIIFHVHGVASKMVLHAHTHKKKKWRPVHTVWKLCRKENLFAKVLVFCILLNLALGSQYNYEMQQIFFKFLFVYITVFYLMPKSQSKTVKPLFYVVILRIWYQGLNYLIFNDLWKNEGKNFGFHELFLSCFWHSQIEKM